jgi:hypothetical protein
MVVDKMPLDALDERVRDAAMTVLPVFYVRSLVASRTSESPLVPWIVNGGIAAAIALALACLLGLIDGSMARRKDYDYLQKVGASVRSLGSLRAWTFALPYGITFFFAVVCGLAVCKVLLANAGIEMPWPTIGLIVITLVVLGALGAAGAAMSRPVTSAKRDE